MIRVKIAAGLACLLATAGVASATQPYPTHQVENQWYRDGQAALAKNKNLTGKSPKAKNVIFFVGDGMGVSTVTAARILEGQLEGRTGEENSLSFERFPRLALSKVYNVDAQVPDSAGTMTAMMTGVKTDIGVINYDEDVVNGDCSTIAGNELDTWLMAAEERGLRTGVVSTARITHATPAATYARVPNRNWEDDSLVPAECKGIVPDIAAQLVDFPYGDGIDVVFGGGRRHFLPATTADPEDAGTTGSRQDGRNLAEEFAARPGAEYVYDRAGFDALGSDTDKVIGLFERSHMEYEFDRPNDTAGEPSLTELTEKSIRLLEGSRKGFALQVESGRIDHAHHGTNAFRALTETIELSEAVKRATELVDMRETLIVVTADHSHVFTISGYPARGSDILGLVQSADPDEPGALDGKPYTTLGYQNGPSVGWEAGTGRKDLTGVDTTDPNFQQPTLVPLGSETHSGEEVSIYAKGPGSKLFQSTVEQNYISHVIGDSLGLTRWRGAAPR